MKAPRWQAVSLSTILVLPRGTVSNHRGAPNLSSTRFGRAHFI